MPWLTVESFAAVLQDATVRVLLSGLAATRHLTNMLQAEGLLTCRRQR